MAVVCYLGWCYDGGFSWNVTVSQTSSVLLRTKEEGSTGIEEVRTAGQGKKQEENYNRNAEWCVIWAAILVSRQNVS